MKAASRRSAAASPALIALPEGAAPSPDAKLVTALGAYRAAVDQQTAHIASPHHPFGTAETKAREDRLAQLCKATDKALLAIAEIPAETPEGLAAKGALVLAILPRELDIHDLEERDPEIQLVLSLARDAVALHGRAA